MHNYEGFVIYINYNIYIYDYLAQCPNDTAQEQL